MTVHIQARTEISNAMDSGLMYNLSKSTCTREILLMVEINDNGDDIMVKLLNAFQSQHIRSSISLILLQ